MTTSLAPNVITKTQEYWAKLGIEIDEDQAEEIARTYLELIDLVSLNKKQNKEADHEAA